MGTVSLLKQLSASKSGFAGLLWKTTSTFRSESIIVVPVINNNNKLSRLWQCSLSSDSSKGDKNKKEKKILMKSKLFFEVRDIVRYKQARQGKATSFTQINKDLRPYSQTWPPSGMFPIREKSGLEFWNVFFLDFQCFICGHFF